MKWAVRLSKKGCVTSLSGSFQALSSHEKRPRAQPKTMHVSLAFLKQARQDVRVTASMLTGSTEVAATPSLMGE